MKKTGFLGILLLGCAACVTVTPPPPSLYMEGPPPAFSAELSLDDRIAVEDAWKLLRAGKAAKAEKIILKLGAQNPFYYAGLGYASLLLNNLSAAEENFRRSAGDFPGLSLAHLGLGQVYQMTGRMEQAYTEYLEVLKRDPENAWVQKEVEAIRLQKTEELMSEAKSFASLGDSEKTKEAYLKALEYSPKLQEAHLALARIYIKEKSYQSALLHLRTANSNEPKNRTVLQDYADALFQAGQLSRSLDAYIQLLEVDPQNQTAKSRSESIKGRLGVVDLPSQFNSIASLNSVTREDVAALIGVKFKDIMDVAAPSPPVIVDITTSWASRYIVRIAAFNIMEVYSNHTFQPNKAITRGEMAEILVRLVAFLKKRGYRIIEQIPSDRIKVADVPQEHFYFQPILQVISYQIMELAPDRTFKPELSVSGQDAIRAFDILLGLIQ